MKNRLAKSNGALPLLLLLLGVSLSTACKNSATDNVFNSNNGNTTSTTTTTTANTNKATTNVEATANKPAAAETGASAQLHTPPDGSPERKAILDAVSEYLKAKQDFSAAVFDDVETLNVHQGWAYIATDVSAPDNSPYGLVEALLQEQGGGRWRVVEVFEYDGSNEKAQWEAFKNRYGAAPADIFPPRQ
jgi:hypothetical protein